MTLRKILIGLAAGAVVGLVMFGLLVARVTTVDHPDTAAASARFDSVREQFADATPKLGLDEEGELVWQTPPRGDVGDIATLKILAYRGPSAGMVEVSIPMWFLRMKEPAIRFALRETGIDLAELQLSSHRLRTYGPAIIFDAPRPDAGHILIWTQAPSGH